MGLAWNNDSLTASQLASTGKMEIKDYMVAFSGQTKSYCVGVVDMINSSYIAATLDLKNISKFYEIFINSMSKIVARFGGFVIKNIGDSLLYYFPESANINRKFGFLACLECNLAMCDAHSTICNKLHDVKLPCLDYRVSSDFGNVIIMSPNDSSIDMLGPPLNMCAKINILAPKNSTVIGGDLYQIVKNFDDYNFKQIKDCSVGLKYSYPVYLISRKN